MRWKPRHAGYRIRPAWNGFGADISNSRFQTAAAAQMTADKVPQPQTEMGLWTGR